MRLAINSNSLPSVKTHLVERFGLLTASILTLAVLGVGTASAATGRDAIGISPTSQLLTAQAGQTLESHVTIINDGDNALNYRLYAQDFKITNEDYQKQFSPGSKNSLDPATWFVLPTGQASVEPHQEAVVDYKIIVPANAGPGSHHAVIFAENIPPATQVNGVRQIKRVGSLVFLSIGGHLQQSGKLLSYHVPWLQTSRPVEANLRLQNNGNDHFQANGEMVLKSLRGHTIRRVAYSGVVVPQTTRHFQIAMAPDSTVGIYKVSGTLNYLGKTYQLAPHWVILAPTLWLILVAIAAILIVSPLVLKVIRPLTRSKPKPKD